MSIGPAAAQSEWKTQDVPELRIIDQATWDAVAAIERSPERIARVRRTPSKRLLSGLIRCGTCGGTFTVVGAERWGCSTARSSGTCANTRTISTMQLESRVLGALRDRLLQPDLVAAFVEEYRREREAHRTTAAASQAKVAAKRAKVTGRIERLTDMMADGIGDYAEMKARLAAALAERDEMDRVSENAEAEPAVAMHPNLAEAYRHNIARITETLNSPELEAGDARQALRNLVELITAEPRAEGRGLDLVVHDRLAQILHIANDRPDISQGGRIKRLVVGAGAGPKHTKSPEGDNCMFEMVAGAGFEPATFRL